MDAAGSLAQNALAEQAKAIHSHSREKLRTPLRTGLILRAPRSTRGASGGVRRCGSGAVARLGCNTHTLSRGSRSCTVPARQPRVTGLWVAAPEGDAHRRRAAEAQQRWIGAVTDQQKERRLKGQST